MIMKEQYVSIRNKGGRPKKMVKKDQLLAVKCSLYERRVIEAKAKSATLSVSEYMREIGLSGKISYRNKVFPKEMLHLTGMLNHLAANLNQIAKKRNSNDELSPLERAGLKVQSSQLTELAVTIKTYYQ